MCTRGDVARSPTTFARESRELRDRYIITASRPSGSCKSANAFRLCNCRGAKLIRRRRRLICVKATAERPRALLSSRVARTTRESAGTVCARSAVVSSSRVTESSSLSVGSLEVREITDILVGVGRKRPTSPLIERERQRFFRLYFASTEILRYSGENYLINSNTFTKLFCCTRRAHKGGKVLLDTRYSLLRFHLHQSSGFFLASTPTCKLSLPMASTWDPCK